MKFTILKVRKLSVMIIGGLALTLLFTSCNEQDLSSQLNSKSESSITDLNTETAVTSVPSQTTKMPSDPEASQPDDSKTEETPTTPKDSKPDDSKTAETPTTPENSKLDDSKTVETPTSPENSKLDDSKTAETPTTPENSKPDEVKSSKTETKTDIIYFQTKKINDNTLEEGKTKIKQAGKNGYKKYKRTINYINGQVSNTGGWVLIDSAKAVDEILLVGSKEKLATNLPEGVEMKLSLYTVWDIERKLPRIIAKSEPMWEQKWVEEEESQLKHNLRSLQDGEYSASVSHWCMNALIIDYSMPTLLKDGSDYGLLFFQQLPKSVQNDLISIQAKREEDFKTYFPNYKEYLQDFYDKNHYYYKFEIKSFLTR